MIQKCVTSIDCKNINNKQFQIFDNMKNIKIIIVFNKFLKQFKLSSLFKNIKMKRIFLKFWQNTLPPPSPPCIENYAVLCYSTSFKICLQFRGGEEFNNWRMFMEYTIRLKTWEWGHRGGGRVITSKFIKYIEI